MDKLKYCSRLLHLEHDYQPPKPCSNSSDGIAFPWRLHELLEAAHHEHFDHIVSWLPDGTSFRVHDKKLFESTVLPKYMSSITRHKSFTRQLNLYCFERVRKGPDRGSYRHNLFVRHHKSLCSRMSVTKIKGVSRPILQSASGPSSASSVTSASSLASTTSASSLQKPYKQPPLPPPAPSPSAAHPTLPSRVQSPLWAASAAALTTPMSSAKGPQQPVHDSIVDSGKTEFDEQNHHYQHSKFVADGGVSRTEGERIFNHESFAPYWDGNAISCANTLEGDNRPDDHVRHNKQSAVNETITDEHGPAAVAQDAPSFAHSTLPASLPSTDLVQCGNDSSGSNIDAGYSALASASSSERCLFDWGTNERVEGRCHGQEGGSRITMGCAGDTTVPAPGHGRDSLGSYHPQLGSSGPRNFSRTQPATMRQQPVEPCHLAEIQSASKTSKSGRQQSNSERAHKTSTSQYNVDNPSDTEKLAKHRFSFATESHQALMPPNPVQQQRQGQQFQSFSSLHLPDMFGRMAAATDPCGSIDRPAPSLDGQDDRGTTGWTTALDGEFSPTNWPGLDDVARAFFTDTTSLTPQRNDANFDTQYTQQRVGTDDSKLAEEENPTRPSQRGGSHAISNYDVPQGPFLVQVGYDGNARVSSNAQLLPSSTNDVDKNGAGFVVATTKIAEQSAPLHRRSLPPGEHSSRDKTRLSSVNITATSEDQGLEHVAMQISEYSSIALDIESTGLNTTTDDDKALSETAGSKANGM